MTSSGQRIAAAEVLAKAKTKTARARVILDGDLLNRHAELEVELGMAEDDAEKQRIADEILDVEAEVAESEVEFVLRGIGRAKWRKLIADNPPTDEERAAGSGYGEDFPYEALSRSLVEPRMTVEELKELDESIDEMQFSALWGACLRANMGTGANRPESRAARAIRENGRPRSQQPSDSESPGAS